MMMTHPSLRPCSSEDYLYEIGPTVPASAIFCTHLATASYCVTMTSYRLVALLAATASLCSDFGQLLNGAEAFVTSSIPGSTDKPSRVLRVSSSHENQNDVNGVDSMLDNYPISTEKSRREVLSRFGKMMTVGSVAALVGSSSAIAADSKVKREMMITEVSNIFLERTNP